MKHRPGVIFRGGFAQDLPIALCHGITADDDVPTLVFDPLRDIISLLQRLPHNKLGRRFPAAGTAFGAFTWRNHLKVMSRL